MSYEKNKKINLLEKLPVFDMEPADTRDAWECHQGSGVLPVSGTNHEHMKQQ